VIALAADVARYEPAPLLEHRHHHERYFVQLGPLARFLLGLCFCPHCLAASQAAGVDGDAVRRSVCAELERVFDRGDDDRTSDVTLERAGSVAGGELAAYQRVREHVVTSLVRDVGAAVREARSTLTFCDLSGAVKGYATGRPKAMRRRRSPGRPASTSAISQPRSTSSASAATPTTRRASSLTSRPTSTAPGTLSASH
jgi:hypothetical protein